MSDVIPTQLLYKMDGPGGSTSLAQANLFREEEECFQTEWVAVNPGKVWILRGGWEARPSHGNGTGLTKCERWE